MHIHNERQLAARAKTLGEAAKAGAFPELTGLTQSASPLVRRLAASALGKLAGIVPATEAVSVLQPLLRDPHPQVRQYTAKALGAFGTAAEPALADLRDLYRNPDEQDYVKRSIVAAGKNIREALRIATEQAQHKCGKCGRLVAADEYARAQKTFQRTYCDKCFDETCVQRRNFETGIEDQKTIRTVDGTLVQSDGERRIAEWLAARRIAYRYDGRLRLIEGFQIRPDFYLPELDVYIEYWGLDTPRYKAGMFVKQDLYMHAGKKLISLYPEDKLNLDQALAPKLAQHGWHPPAANPAAAARPTTATDAAECPTQLPDAAERRQARSKSLS